MITLIGDTILFHHRTPATCTYQHHHALIIALARVHSITKQHLNKLPVSPRLPCTYQYQPCTLYTAIITTFTSSITNSTTFTPSSPLLLYTITHTTAHVCGAVARQTQPVQFPANKINVNYFQTLSPPTRRC